MSQFRDKLLPLGIKIFSMGLLCSMLLLLPLFTFAQRTGGYSPMSQKEWFGNYEHYMSESKKLSKENNADKHYTLGKWAWDHGLEDEAWEQWLEALKDDSNHASSYKAMGFEKVGDKWQRPGEVDSTWVADVKKAGRALTYTFAFADNVDPAFFEEFSWRVRRLNWFIWDLTEGQMYLNEIKIVDKSTEGRFLIDEGRLYQTLLTGGGAVCYGAGGENWYVKSGGRCYVRIFCHELFHGIFGLPDERHGCICLMQGGLYGIKTPDIALCDKDSHRESSVTPTPCWELVMQKFPDMKHTKKNHGRAPEVKIEIVDN